MPETRLGLFGFHEVEAALTDLLGRRVDLNTADSLSKHFRDEVLAEAETLYVAAYARLRDDSGGNITR